MHTDEHAGATSLAAPVSGRTLHTAAIQVQCISLPGGGKPNEDAALATPELIVVLDGLTSPDTLGSGCIHGTPWYVKRLAAHIADRSTTDTPLTDVLAEAIEITCGDHGGACDLNDPGTPSATVAILRRVAQDVEYLVLSDCTALLPDGDAVRVVTDPRAEQMELDLQREVKSAPWGSRERRDLTDTWITVQRAYRNVAGGYWIAGAVPEAVCEALTGTVPFNPEATYAAMSDGASRYADLLGLGDWREALLLARRSVAALMNQVRQCEMTDPDCTRWPRWKPFDDATVCAWSPMPCG